MEISSSSSGVRIVTAPLVNVRVTSNVNNFTAEKRFDRGLTIADLKGRLEMMTGGSAGNMSLQVFDTSERLVDTLTGDTTLLGAFCVEENYRIHTTHTRADYPA
ncbi:Tubulin-folding cofactor B [Chionoecetes opilio]|uniref:Tubulin-folding cofactor B n=1 Tax=Chionoecetes opilio TaxID=41210 RepID=A0A8J4XRL6_CHIOP|nr:Tubulin-folding cofactor B [Chionoecetes opilio]